jgi:hypothetical protein
MWGAKKPHTILQSLYGSTSMTIYINHVDMEYLVEWLKSIFVLIEGPMDGGDGVIYHFSWQDQIVPTSITTEMESSGYTQVWFNTNQLPWQDQLELVKQVSDFFETQVRYDKSNVFYEYFKGQTRVTTEWD